MRDVALALALVVLCLSRPAFAQDPSAYVGGSFFVSTQDSHEQGSEPGLPRTGVGGTTWGGTGEIGVFVLPNLGVGVEFTLPARIAGVQETDYLQVFQTRSRYRDMTIAAVARGYTPGRHGVRAAAVGGVLFVEESVFQSRAYAAGSFPNFSRDFGPFSGEEESTRWTTGFVAGGDVEIALSRRFSIVPQMRVEWVRRSEDPSEPVWVLGLSSWVLRPAIGVRAAF